MGYWIHVEELPTGGGSGNGPGCLGCLGVLAGIAAVLFALGYVKENLISVLSCVLAVGALASLVGIIYMLKETGFEKGLIIAGIVGFAVGACFALKILGVFGIVAIALGGRISMGLILAATAMFLYALIF